MTGRTKIFAVAVLAAAGLAGVPRVSGQMPKGTVSGFRYPDYDPNGVLRSLVLGESAKVLNESKVEIAALQLEIYRADKVETRVTSPFCVFNPQTRAARSESSIRIVRENLTITGEGFSWEPEAQRFVIENKARVVIQGLSKKPPVPIGAGR